MRARRRIAVAAVVVALCSVAGWAALPRADASVNVIWSAGTVVVGNGTNLNVNVTNQTNTAQNAVIFVRKFDGTLQSPVANTNTISGLVAGQSTGRAYACASGPCSFSIKVTTNSTQVLPSASYSDFTADAEGLSAGDFVVKVIKT